MAVFAVIIVLLIIFILFRDINCWYFKTNKIVDNLKALSDKIDTIDRKLNENLRSSSNSSDKLDEISRKIEDEDSKQKQEQEKKTEQDVQKYRTEAEQGDAEAQYKLGMCYEYGNGVEKNIAEADRWYGKAAAQRHQGALKKLGY